MSQSDEMLMWMNEVRLVNDLTIHPTHNQEPEWNPTYIKTWFFYLPVEEVPPQSDLHLHSPQALQVGRTVSRRTAAEWKDRGPLACNPASPWRK